MRLRSTLALPAVLACVLVLGLAGSNGCAGASKGNPGSAGSGGSGAAGAGSPGTAGSSNPGTGGAAGQGAAGSGGLGAAGSTGSPGVAGAGAAGAGDPGTAGTGGAGTTGTAGSGPAGGLGTDGSAGSGSAGVSGTAGSGPGGPTDGGTDAVCQMAQYEFEPKIPTVYLLVDRSGSMFHCLTGNTGNVICDQPANTAWSNLKEAVRSVTRTLQNEVRFGFATIWGTDPAQGGMCPSIQGMVTDNVAPAINNATAIMARYDALQFPPNTNQAGVKFESPTSYSLKAVTQALTATTAPGDKYILFITDGQPDYCDDSNSLCAPDSVIAQIQAAKAAGITTIVLGVQTTLFDLPPGILKAYATAGAGEPTVAPLRSATANITDFYDQCQSIAGWRNDLTASGKPNARGTTLGAYSATAGPTNPYMPSAADQGQLVAQLMTALAGLKSCTFDLNDVGGKSIKVDPMKLDQARVKVEGVEIPQNATNGWSLGASTSELVLNGNACTTWRMPDSKVIDFQFPCSIIIFE